MSERRTLETHRRSLGEIREIVSSMKSLAYIETRRLARRLAAQRAVLATVTAAGNEVLAYHPSAALQPSRDGPLECVVVVGSERGFCGDLNHALVRYIDALPPAEHGRARRLIAVGHKLCSLLDGDVRVVASVDGPGSVEEVGAALNRIVAALDRLEPARGVTTLAAVYHASRDEIVARTLLPAFQSDGQASAPKGIAPVLNLEPDSLLLELTDQHLFAALHEILFAALAAENHRRIEHLEGAVRHLDDRVSRLGRRLNALRQEEIIEEIEVILLSAELQRGARAVGMRRR
jgi:F-type H+-transporting ATPase subunit gamma